VVEAEKVKRFALNVINLDVAIRDAPEPCRALTREQE
jgi:hypothetical protein